MHQPQQKSVLILDDNESLRDDLRDALRDREFLVEAAALPDKALGLIEKYEGGPDVCVIDMYLVPSKPTGAQFGLELRRRFPSYPPEFLIYSGYSEPDYYKQAFDLDAAMYLSKGSSDISDVVRHARVLALRRAIGGGRPGILEEIEQIAGQSQSRSEAIVHFWQEVVSPELARTLGTPFLILQSRAGGSRVIANTFDFPPESGAYAWIQKLIDIQANRSDPLVLDSRLRPLDLINRDVDAAILRRLWGTSFVSLLQTDDSHISLGLVQQDVNEFPLAEDSYALARLVSTYFQPAITNLLLTVTARWTAIHMRQRAILETTSRFCLYVGQEQISLVDKAMESGRQESDELAQKMYKLRLLGEELRAAGELLGEVADPQHQPAKGQEINVADIVNDAWEDLLIDFPDLKRTLLSVEGDCLAFVKPGTFYLALSRILHWFARRNADLVENETARVHVSCDPQKSEIRIWDTSSRLAPEARKNLFSLFSVISGNSFRKLSSRGEFLGLYLSKVLIEMENGGSLRDLTESSEHDSGNCLLIGLPRTDGGLRGTSHAY